MRKRWTTAFGVALLVGGSSLIGCSTTGTKETISDTHRRVAKLSGDMESTVTKLNETTAQLNARVEQGDQEVRALKTVTEENQVRLENIDRSLRELKDFVYRQSGYTTSPGSTPVGVPEILPPPGRTPTTAVAEPPPISMSAPPVTPAPVVPVNPVSSPVAPPPAATPVTPVPAATPTPAVAPVTPVAPVAVASGDAKDAYQQAQRSYANENYEEALRSFDSFLQRYSDPDLRANAQFWKAKCYLNLDRFSEAITEFQRVRAEYPGSTKVPFAMHNQAVAHSRLGQTDQAVKLLQEVVTTYPATPAADQAKSDLKKLQGGN